MPECLSKNAIGLRVKNWVSSANLNVNFNYWSKQKHTPSLKQ